MGKRKHDFKDDDKIKVMLWCGRHCCLCGKFSGIGIEVAHLEKDDPDIENAMPLCFNCHASVWHYNNNHPKGKKYSIRELKARRNQIYELQTQHLISPVQYKLTQANHKLPEVGFVITNLGDTYPIKARIEITLCQGREFIGHPESSGHYNGSFMWNLNPKFGFSGWFRIPKLKLKSDASIRAKVEVTIIDIYDYKHKLLPGGYIKNTKSDSDWYYEPSIEEHFVKKKRLSKKKG